MSDSTNYEAVGITRAENASGQIIETESLVDLDALFHPLQDIEAPVTGYEIEGGIDLNKRFESIASGTEIDLDTGYTITIDNVETDLKKIFAKIGSVSSNLKLGKLPGFGEGFDCNTYFKIVLDTSGSMASALPYVRNAITQIRNYFTYIFYPGGGTVANKYILNSTDTGNERWCHWIGTDWGSEAKDRKEVVIAFINESNSIYHGNLYSFSGSQTGIFNEDYDRYKGAYNGMIDAGGRKWAAVMGVDGGYSAFPAQIKHALDDESYRMKDMGVTGNFDIVMSASAQFYVDKICTWLNIPQYVKDLKPEAEALNFGAWTSRVEWMLSDIICGKTGTWENEKFSGTLGHYRVELQQRDGNGSWTTVSISTKNDASDLGLYTWTDNTGSIYYRIQLTAVGTGADSGKTKSSPWVYNERKMPVVTLTASTRGWAYVNWTVSGDNTSNNYIFTVSKNPDMSNPVKVEALTYLPENYVYSNADSCTTYYCQVTGDGLSEIEDNTTDPCLGITTSGGPEGPEVMWLRVNNVPKGIKITASQQLTGELNGVTRPIAYDEFKLLFISASQALTPGCDGGGVVGGKMVLDGGFPKFYNSKWSNWKATNGVATLDKVYSSTEGQWAYFINALLYVTPIGVKPSNAKILYINDGTPGMNYSLQATTEGFHETIKELSALHSYGYTALSRPQETITDTGKDAEHWNNILTEYDVIVYLGTTRTDPNPISLSPGFLSGMKAFMNRGGGLFGITDDNAFQEGINQVIKPYGINFTGDKNRTASHNAYKISTILADIEGGYHPLFEGLSSSSSISAGRSEGVIVDSASNADTMSQLSNGYSNKFTFNVKITQDNPVYISTDTGCVTRVPERSLDLTDFTVPLEAQAPVPGARAHFSGGLMSTVAKPGHWSKIFEDDEMGEFVGIGDYPDNSAAFPEAINTSFDSIAVDAGVRCVIYSGQNYTGSVLFDKTGPFVLWNSLFGPGGEQEGDYRWSIWEDGNDDPQQLGVKYEDIFPEEVRMFSESDMRTWNSGSMKLRKI